MRWTYHGHESSWKEAAAVSGPWVELSSDECLRQSHLASRKGVMHIQIGGEVTEEERETSTERGREPKVRGAFTDRGCVVDVAFAMIRLM